MSERQEIKGWFIPRVTPYGGAPEEIKKQWVDVPLPLRYIRSEAPEGFIGETVGDPQQINILADSVTVEAVDALKALRVFGRTEAADWWDGYIGGRGADLGFAVETGDQVLSANYLPRILPGIEDFDQVEV
jgi:hypothetical protein